MMTDKRVEDWIIGLVVALFVLWLLSPELRWILGGLL
jgi:hypothetical protein